ncbi:hypothetical protein OQA88_12450 [Cercophora sp. LCS_1]
MADPLSVAASIVGLLSATASVSKVLGPYISAARDTPQIAHHVNTEVQTTSIILSALQSLAQNMASVSVQRAALVEIDQVVAILTSGVIVFSDLEASVSTLPVPDSSSITRLALRSRFQWVRKEDEFAKLLSRLQSFKISLSALLNILQSDTSLRAEQHRVELATNVAQLLENDQSLSRRLMSLEDSFDAHTIVMKRRSITASIGDQADDETRLLSSDIVSPSARFQPPASSNAPVISSFEFEHDLNSSRPYRRAQRDTMDFSFRSSVARSDAWSVFSGLTLGDISIMSVIALPIYADEITNSHHYGLGRQPPTVNVKDSAEPLANVIDDESLLRICLNIQLLLCQLPKFGAFSNLDSWNHPFTAIQETFKRGTPLLVLCQLFRQFDVESVKSRYQLRGGDIATEKDAASWALTAVSESSLFSSDEVPTVSQVVNGDTLNFLKVIGMIERILLLENDFIRTVDTAEVNRAIQRNRSVEDSVEFLLLDDFTKRSWTLLRELIRLFREQQVEELRVLPAANCKIILTSIEAIIRSELSFLLAAEAILQRRPSLGYWAEIFEQWENCKDSYGYVIGSLPRNSRLLRAHLDDEADLVGRKAIVDALDLISLPSRLLDIKSEFLSTLKAVITGADTLDDTARRRDFISTQQNLNRCRDRISHLVKEEELLDIRADLSARLVDWKGQNLEDFGKLLLYDQDVTARHSKNTITKASYRMYLFEEILLLCREIQPPRFLSPRSLQRRATREPNSRIQLELSGGISLRDVLHVLPHSGPASVSVVISWAPSEPYRGVESVETRFRTTRQKEVWRKALEDALQSWKESNNQTPHASVGAYLAGSEGLVNPYVEDSDPE